MPSGIRVGLDEVLVHFSELEDPRSHINQRHPLVSVGGPRVGIQLVNEQMQRDFTKQTDVRRHTAKETGHGREETLKYRHRKRCRGSTARKAL